MFHAQHHSAAPRVLLTVQHRILGASLAVGGLTRGAAELPVPAARSFKTAWLVPLFLAGVQLLLYTETSG